MSDTRPVASTLAIIATLCLTGCVGGPIARQVASSIAMNVADSAVGKALDDPQLGIPQTTKTNQLLVNNGLDPYQQAFLRAQFVTMPAPPAPAPTPPSSPDPAASAAPVVSRIEAVEVWALIIGQEKQTLLENLQQLGLRNAPPPSEWDRWQVAEGGIPDQKDTHVLFLIPPELGKMKSGDRAIIELAASGLNIARDRLDP